MDSQVREQMIELLPRLQRFAYALTNSKADGDDLLQATFVRAIENLEKWTVGSRLDSWMYRIAQNLHKNQMRHSVVKAKYAEKTLAEDIGCVDGVREVMRHDELKKVALSIDQLPADQQAVLLLVAVEGYGYKEASQILDIPVGTVTSRLARARKSLTDDIYGEKE